jgi:hypothetical protein
MGNHIPWAFERMEEDMSLVDEFKAPCVMLDKQRKPDGEGGFITTWIEGAKFVAAITYSTSIEARLAEKQGVTSRYTVTTDKKIALEYHDVFRRLYDGKIFRVTSDGDDVRSPERASFSMAVVTAEEWELPGGVVS